MTHSLLSVLFTVRHTYPNQLLRQRARSLLITCWVAIVGWLVYMLGLALPNILNGSSPGLYLNAGLIGLPIASLLAIWMLQRGRLRTSAFILTGMLLLGTLPLIFTSPEGLLPLAVVPALVAAGVLLNQRQFLLFALIVLAGMIARALLLGTVTEPYVVVPANNVDLLIIVPLVTLGLSAVFLYVFSGSDERILTSTLDEANYLRAVAEQPDTTIDPGDEDALLSDAVRRLEQAFGLFNAQIYMLSDEQQLVRRLRMALGMVAGSSHSAVGVGSATLVGEAAASKQIIAVDRTSDAARRALIAAPARCAIAVPLIDGDQVIGVLEGQGDQNLVFTQVQIESISLLAQQTARRIVMARRLKLLAEQAQDAQESLAHLTGQLRAQDEQMRQNLRSGWNDYLKKRKLNALGFDLDMEGGSQSLRPADDLPDDLRAAMERGEPVIESARGGQQINVPIIFRGELMGAMSFTLPADSQLSERQIELARNVAERLGSALENARLLEQTQAQAQREAQASTIGTRLLGIPDVQTVLDLAAADFQTALGAVYTHVHMNVNAAEDSQRAPQEAS